MTEEQIATILQTYLKESLESSSPLVRRAIRKNAVQEIRSELAHLLEEVESVIGEVEAHDCTVGETCPMDHVNGKVIEQHKALTQLRKKYLGD